MVFVSRLVVYLIMVCAFLGCLASIFRKGSGLGREFLEGVNTLGTLFIPIAGVMASLPYLKIAIVRWIGPLFSVLGADSSMAATTFIASDMGGYQLAASVAQDGNALVIALFNGLMAGATLVFSFPIALKMLPKEEHKSLSLGMMYGFLSIPFGVLVSSLIAMAIHPLVRDSISSTGTPSVELTLTLPMIFRNLLPLFLICLLFVFFLVVFPKGSVKAFSLFGDVLDALLRIVFTLSVIQYFTGMFSHWGFDPIMADSVDSNRALEMSGYIAIMLSGAYPMVYLMRRYLSSPLERLGRRFSFSSDAMSAMLASLANSIALFALVGKMGERDKVRVIAFSVGASFILGDHLAFMATWQPTLIVPMIVGKLSAGLLALLLADIPFRRKERIG